MGIRARSPLIYMSARTSAIITVACALVLPSNRPLIAQTKDIDVSVLKWRSLGPYQIGGRVTDIAVPNAVEGERTRPGVIFYVASLGGLYRTENEGQSWTPLFDKEASAAVSTIEISPVNPSVLWAGTGDFAFVHTQTLGTGLYRSNDAGKNWTRVGFANSEQIGAVAPHPSDANGALAAVLGPIGRPSRERGIYRTTDGGKTWTQTLFVNDRAGAVDVKFDPFDANVAYAAIWEQKGSPVSYVLRGEGSGIFKSTDGGATWRRITSGMPAGHLGRIALSPSPARRGRVYALISTPTGRNGGPGVILYRSNDAGESWTVGATTNDANGWYFTKVEADPSIPDRVYVGQTALFVSDDAGATLRPTHTDFMTDMHADVHAIWIDPTDPNHIIAGNDGGAWITRDRGEHWHHIENLSMALVRTVEVDNQKPVYNVYEQAQDHGTYAAPVRTRHSDGIIAADWYETYGGESGGLAADPKDPNYVYAEFLRLNRKSGVVTQLGPYTGMDVGNEQGNQVAPIIVSPHDPQTIYLGTTRVYRSTDWGENFTAVTGQLVPNRSDANIQGGSWTGQFYKTISAIAESPAERGIVYAGTQVGTLVVSRDGGTTWTNVQISGAPKDYAITRIAPSPSSGKTVYVTVHGAYASDPRPYVFRSDDYGKSWRSISGDLPSNAGAWAAREHPRSKDLLFVATDIGVFYSMNGGANWLSLRNNMPAVRVRDLVIQSDANDLAIGTYGRGVWILDNVGPLVELAAAQKQAKAALFPVRDALKYSEGDMETLYNARRFAAPNPPAGAMIDYYLPSRVSKATLEVVDGANAVIRQLSVPTGAGLQRTNWDLRVSLPVLDQQRASKGDYQLRTGGIATAGTYRLRLKLVDSAGKDSVALERNVVVQDDPNAPVTPQAVASLERFRSRSIAVAEQVRMLESVANTLKTQVLEANGAATVSKVDRALLDRGKAVLAAIDSALAKIVGPPNADRDAPPSLNSLASTFGNAASGQVFPPTAMQNALLAELENKAKEIAPLVRRLQVETVPAYFRQLDQAGVPWTTGREVR
jgi:photosystem II stability/assembly factor-like uncharacterized protein